MPSLPPPSIRSLNANRNDWKWRRWIRDPGFSFKGAQMSIRALRARTFFTFTLIIEIKQDESAKRKKENQLCRSHNCLVFMNMVLRSKSDTSKTFTQYSCFRSLIGTTILPSEKEVQMIAKLVWDIWWCQKNAPLTKVRDDFCNPLITREAPISCKFARGSFDDSFARCYLLIHEIDLRTHKMLYKMSEMSLCDTLENWACVLKMFTRVIK